MSECPPSIQVQSYSTSRIGWLGASIAASVVLWLVAGAVGLGVAYRGWPGVWMSAVCSLAITATVCAVQLGIAHADRKAITHEHAMLLGAVRKELEEMRKRVGDVEWQVCERLPSDALEPRTPVLSLARPVNGHRGDN